MDTRDFARSIAGSRSLAAASDEIKRELLIQFESSPLFAIRNFLYTNSKDGELVALDPWNGQVILDLCLESQRRRGYPQRVVEIKPRQVGWTAYNLARAFWAAMQPRTKVGILVNDDDVAADLMLRIGAMYNNLPKWMRPMKRIDNPKQLILDNPNARERDERPGLNSLIHVTVPNALRGFTPNYFLWSEAAFCDDWEEVADGVMGGIALNKKSCIVIDTTPNGDDPFYKPLVYEAVARNPKWVAGWERKGVPTREEITAGILGEPDDPRAGWVPAFMPWFWHPEYDTQNENPEGQLPAIDAGQIQHIKATLGKVEAFGGEEELELVQRYDVALSKIFWRRYKIQNDTLGNDPYEKLLTFRQELTHRWDAGFIKFGRGAFDSKGLDKLFRYMGPGSTYGVRPPAARGCLRQEPNGRIYMDQTFQSDFLEVRQWAPAAEDRFVAFLDTANAYNSADSDSTIFMVMRRRDHKIVAMLDCKAPPNVYEEQVWLLYQYYNKPYTAIEMENDGYDLAYRFLKRGLRNQYYYKRTDVEDPEPSKYLGWETNRKTRPLMQNALVRAIAAKDRDGNPEPDLIIPDQKTMQEILDVTRDPEGRIANHGAGHDDTVVSVMGCLAMCEDEWGGLFREPNVQEQKREMNSLIRGMGLVAGSSNRNSPRYDLL